MSGRAGPWLLAVVVVAAAGYALLTGSSTSALVERGSDAPDFSLPGVGDTTDLSLADLRGRVVLLNFWATWCKPCEDEMPAMERLYRELQAEGLELVAISVDDDLAPVEEFVRRLALTFPVLHDADQSAARDYQTFRFPESLLVGPDGVVVERYIGPKEWDAPAYVARIRRLLSEGS